MASASTGSGFRRQLRAVAALASVSFAATPVVASPWDLPPPKVNSAALLRGESALLRTWSSQGLSPASTPAGIPTPVTMAVATGPASFSLVPTSRYRSEYFAGQAFTKPAVQHVRSASGGPNVFGSVSLAIGTTPYDNMWRRASTVNSHALAGWTQTFAAVQDGDADELLRAVNRWVNRRIQFTEDNVAGVPAELWQNAADSLRSRRGDCEDYALAKLALLAAMGIDRNDLYLVIARDLIARNNHAVLAVRSGDRLVILDNATDELVAGDRLNDYRPIFSYSVAGRWIHGFSDRPAQPPVQIASASAALITAP